MNKAEAVALAMPAVIDDNILITGILHSVHGHCIGSLAKQSFVHIAGEFIPAVPSHRRSERQSVEFLCMQKRTKKDNGKKS